MNCQGAAMKKLPTAQQWMYILPAIGISILSCGATGIMVLKVPNSKGPTGRSQEAYQRK